MFRFILSADLNRHRGVLREIREYLEYITRILLHLQMYQTIPRFDTKLVNYATKKKKKDIIFILIILRIFNLSQDINNSFVGLTLII